MHSMLLPSFLLLACCAGCAGPTGPEQADGCTQAVVASSYAPVSCGPNGWRNGGVVTNRNSDGPHIEIWGPPSTAPTGRE